MTWLPDEHERTTGTHLDQKVLMQHLRQLVDALRQPDVAAPFGDEQHP